MSKRAFDKIMRGLEDAHAYLEGTADKSRYRVHVDKSDGRKTRTRPGSSQQAFAKPQSKKRK